MIFLLIKKKIEFIFKFKQLFAQRSCQPVAMTSTNFTK